MADIVMPRLSDTMEEGTIARWLKQPGDPVTRGEVIAEVDTDKATMDLEVYEDGVLDQILVEAGSAVPIGQPIATLAAAGETSAGTSAPAGAPPAPATAPAPAHPPAPAGETPPSRRTGGRPGGGAPPAAPAEPTSFPRSSPLARALARRHGLDLAAVRGSGPFGRIVRADVEAAVARGPDGPPASSGRLPTTWPLPGAGSNRAEVEEIPLGTLRRRTAERLALSVQVPHFALTSVVDAATLLAFRSEANRDLREGAPKITVTDLLVKACAGSLLEHPEVNASWGGDKLLRYGRIHVGVAVAVPEGLVVPVVKDADRKTLLEIARETRALAERARQGKLGLDDITGGTFTISNLGMFGVDHFTAVINPPQAAILAVGSAKEEPVVRDGEIVAGTTIKLTLSVDHRVLDGATAARFLADLRDALEHPMRLVL